MFRIIKFSASRGFGPEFRAHERKLRPAEA
jgi:hypothetical protein